MVSGEMVTATPKQEKAAESTINLEEIVNKFVIESKKAIKINFLLTGIIILLTIVNVGVAVFEKCFE